MKKWFQITLMHNNCEVSSGILELDQRVLARVTENWRKAYFPDLTTEEKIASHIARRIIYHRAHLSQLVGWNDLPDTMARMVEAPKAIARCQISAHPVPAPDRPRSAARQSAARQSTSPAGIAP